MRVFEITRQIAFDETVDVSALPDHLAESLRSVRARAVRVEGNRVLFKGGMFRLVAGLNTLNAFGRGILIIRPEHREVEYRLSVRQLVFTATVAVSVAEIAIMLFSVPWQIRALPVFFGLWIIAANFWIGGSGFRNLLSLALKMAPRLS
jgi:hypothetical protein